MAETPEHDFRAEDAWMEPEPPLAVPRHEAGAGEFDELEDHEHEDQRELSLLYRHKFDDSLQFNRGNMRMAIRHGRRLAAQQSSDVSCLVDALEASLKFVDWVLSWKNVPLDAPVMAGIVEAHEALAQAKQVQG